MERLAPGKKDPRSLRLSAFLTQSQSVECVMESEGLPGDRSSPRLHTREITITIKGSQT